MTKKLESSIRTANTSGDLTHATRAIHAVARAICLRCFKDALDRLPDERRDAIYALMPGHPDFEKLIDLFDRVLTATADA